MRVFDFLCRHWQSANTPEQWADLFGIDILDADGWADADFRKPIGMVEFLQRVMRSTINYHQ